LGPGFHCVQLRPQPGAGKPPLALHGRGADAQGLRRLLDRAAGEVAQLNHLRLLRIQRAEPHERLVQRQQVDAVGVRLPGRRRLGVAHRDAGAPAATLLGTLLPRVVQQDASHGQCGGTEEVGPVIEPGRVAAREPQPGFVHQRGRLQRVVGPFLPQVGARQGPQLVVDDLEQVGRRLAHGRVGRRRRYTLAFSRCQSLLPSVSTD